MCRKSLLNDRHAVMLRDAFIRRRAALSAFHCVSVYLWQGMFDVFVCTIDDSIGIFFNGSGSWFMYLPPLGTPVTPAVAEQWFAFMERRNSSSGISRIENVDRDTAALLGGWGYRVVKEHPEYIYRRAALVHLRGKRLKSKRSAYNSFAAKNHAVYRPYEESDRAPCVDLCRRWGSRQVEKAGSDEYRRALAEDSVKIQLSMFERDLFSVGLVGRVVAVEGNVAGYTFGFMLNDDTFCVLFEVCDYTLNGIFQYIFREICYEMRAATYINVMDDSGIEAVRRVKESYCPDMMVERYTVYPPASEGGI